MRYILMTFSFFFGLSSIAYATTVTSLDNFTGTFIGEDAGDEAGSDLAVVGDVNGDGYEDILIGAINASGIQENSSAAYLLYGGAGSSFVSGEIDLSQADAAFFGVNERDGAEGITIGTGDVNTDGYSDILIGQGAVDQGVSAEVGTLYIFFGNQSMLSGTISLNAADVKIVGENAGARLSRSAVGDVNGDSVNDIIVGAHYESSAGAVYIFYGDTETGFSGEIDASAADVKITGAFSDDFFGAAIATGNVNADAYDDILIGASGATGNNISAGSAYLVYGSNSLSSGSITTVANSQFDGETNNDAAGGQVYLKDINNDGYDDIFISATEDDTTASNAGIVYLRYGQAATIGDVSLIDFTVNFVGDTTNGRLGTDIGHIADVNGDGYNDIMLTATKNSGTTYIFFGQASALSSTVEVSSAAYRIDQVNAPFSYVSGGGDVNGDGYDDILIGATGADQGGNDAGAVYLGYLVDAVAPSITLSGSSTHSVECSVTYTDAGVSAVSDNIDQTLSVNDVVTVNSVNTSTTGSYAVSYSIEDAAGNTGTATRTVTVQDTVAPTLALVGDSVVDVVYGDTYTDAGATVTESCDSSILVTTSGTVDTNTVGTYTLTYSASDDAGNSATQITRTVNVTFPLSQIESVVGTKKGFKMILENGAEKIVSLFNEKTDEKSKVITFDEHPDLVFVLRGNGKTAVLARMPNGEKLDQQTLSDKGWGKNTVKKAKIHDKPVYVITSSAGKRNEGRVIIMKRQNKKEQIGKKHAATIDTTLNVKKTEPKKKKVTVKTTDDIIRTFLVNSELDLTLQE